MIQDVKCFDAPLFATDNIYVVTGGGDWTWEAQ